MAALIPIYGSTQSAARTDYKVGTVAVRGSFMEQMQELRGRTAERCHRVKVALHWRVAEEFRSIRLSSSELLHVAGVLHELASDSMRRCARNLWVGFRFHRQNLALVVEDDGDHDLTLPGWPSELRNVEYQAAHVSGRIRHRALKRGWASILWLPLDA